MPYFDRYYTIEEANSLLPQVREKIAGIHGLRDRLATDWGQANPVLDAAPHNGGGGEASPYITDLTELSALLSWFSRRGILLKDIDRGLVDFPALRDGREVLLCWELAEDRIGFWHDLETGYAGREPW
jgi:hypothetical protein